MRTDPALERTVGAEPAWRFELSCLLGKLVFKFLWRSIAKSRVKPFGIVDLIYEPWQPLGYVGECFVSGKIDLFNLWNFHEALDLSVVIWISYGGIVMSVEVDGSQRHQMCQNEFVEISIEGDRPWNRLPELVWIRKSAFSSCME